MSEKVTLEEFESTGDPMLDDNFEIIFSKLPVNGQAGVKVSADAVKAAKAQLA